MNDKKRIEASTENLNWDYFKNILEQGPDLSPDTNELQYQFQVLEAFALMNSEGHLELMEDELRKIPVAMGKLHNRLMSIGLNSQTSDTVEIFAEVERKLSRLVGDLRRQLKDRRHIKH